MVSLWCHGVSVSGRARGQQGRERWSDRTPRSRPVPAHGAEHGLGGKMPPRGDGGRPVGGGERACVQVPRRERTDPGQRGGGLEKVGYRAKQGRGRGAGCGARVGSREPRGSRDGVEPSSDTGGRAFRGRGVGGSGKGARWRDFFPASSRLLSPLATAPAPLVRKTREPFRSSKPVGVGHTAGTGRIRVGSGFDEPPFLLSEPRLPFTSVLEACCRRVPKSSRRS